MASDPRDEIRLGPSDAVARALEWRELPIGRTRELRRHKNVTAHLERPVSHLPPGPVRDRLLLWSEPRRSLP
ncbi:hypothetical protein [Streptomyces fagopyri]|uniref:hypothetical protein n=1 Tax=Streptomyces fagopyri TaxID=2662397 RepID=UPI0034084377